MLVIRDVSNKIVLESIMSPSVSARGSRRRPGAAEGEEQKGRREQSGKSTRGPRLRLLISVLFV